jgi:predicted AlkP superfamily phosphohydrolase/phosphomutase
MSVLVLGLDGATWSILRPLMEAGDLPALRQICDAGASGTIRSVFPPLSPVAWTTIMTGKNPGAHGVFEFLEFRHDPEKGRVNSSRSIQSELVWEVAGRHGKRTVAGAVPLSYPHRNSQGFYLGDFLAPANAKDFASDPAIMAELEQELGEAYQPWSTSVHDGGREAEVLEDLTRMLDQHIRTVRFLMKRCDWDLFFFDLMATDRIQHELWHAWEPAHRAAKGRDLSAIREGFISFWKRLDHHIGELLASLDSSTNVILLSDHGFGPIEWYVNFNVWLLEHNYIQLQDRWYVKQKHWCYRRGITPESFYRMLSKLGKGSSRVSRFRGKQLGTLDRIADEMFLSRKHIDWSKTKAYAQGNFGQIFLNLKGRQPHGCVEPEDAARVLSEIKAALLAIKDPETGAPLIAHVYERDELYTGAHTELAPDLTVVTADWRYRTVGLYDFTTNQFISPGFGPTGDHRLDGVFFGHGPAFRPGSQPVGANLADVAPTVLRLLGVPIPGDLDGRVLEEVIADGFVVAPATVDALANGAPHSGDRESGGDSGYSADDEANIEQRLADLGYL